MKSITTIVISIALTISAAQASEVTCPKLNNDQLSVLQHAHEFGLQFDLGKTLPAIALTESSAGKHLVNANSKDFGVYQSNRKTLCAQAGFSKDDAACDQEVFNVVVDINTASKHAVHTLLYWREYHKKRDFMWYEHMLRSYNEGFDFKNPKATKYWELFKKNLNIVKQCTNIITKKPMTV